MKKNNFVEKMEEVKIPVLPRVSHKAYLKEILHRKIALQPEQTPHPRPIFWRWTMAGLASFFLLIWLVNNFVPANQTTVRAATILRQTIENIIEVSKKRGEYLSKDTQLTLEILNTALVNRELRYIGEKVDSNGQKITVLGFFDEGLSDQIAIYIRPYQDFDPAYVQNYSLYLVTLSFESQYVIEAASVYFTSEIQNKQIVDLVQLKQDLRDEKLKSALTTQLIQHQNRATLAGLESSLKEGMQMCDEGMGGPSEEQQKLFTRPGNLSDQELLKRLRPLVEESNVLVDSLLCQHDLSGKIYRFNLALKPLSKLQKSKLAARNVLQTILTRLQEDQSPQFALKRKLLEKALQSPTLLQFGHQSIATDQFSSDEKGNVSRVYKQVIAFTFQNKPCLAMLENCTTIKVFIDPEAKSYQDVAFDFIFWQGGENPVAVVLEAKIVDGVITNSNELIGKLQNRTEPHDQVRALVEFANREIIRRWEVYGALDGNKLAELLKPIVEQSEFVILQADPEPPLQQPGKMPEKIIIRAIPMYELFI